jgi:Leucine-rich repeat (LRR) protein
MCEICTKDYDISLIYLLCCENVKIVPKELINLDTLYCDKTQIKKIPKTLINLKELYCQNTQIRKIFKTLIKLQALYCNNSQIKKIPKTLINLKELYCNNDVLISPQTYITEPNNKYYLTFTRCQARYKLKLRLKNLKFAYHPKYIIGHNTKKQLAKLFQN